jgi:predicted RNA-binding Zn-ribbon protein involved in translation (DUF1610 family)
VDGPECCSQEAESLSSVRIAPTRIGEHMANLTCPNGHNAVIRNDPKTTGFMAQCDTCGWTARKVVARETAVFEDDHGHELASAQAKEQSRRLEPARR